MTKAYLKFPVKKVSYAPRFVSRRFPQGQHMSVAYKEDGDDDAERVKLLADIQLRFDKSLEGTATKVELEAIRLSQADAMKNVPVEQLRELLDEKDGVVAMITRQGLEMQRIQAKMSEVKQPEDMSVRGQVERWMKENEKAIINIRDNKQKVNLSPLEVRVASPMTPATVNSTSSPYIGSVEIESGITPLVRRRPVFWDYIIKGSTNSQLYVWVNETNPLGDAAWLAPGELKPGVSFALDAENSVAKKIAVSAKAAMELLQDIDGMVTFIEQEMKYKLNDKINSTLMVGAGDSKTPKGIQNYAVTYTETGIFTENANYMDSLRAAVAQLNNSWLGGDITIFVNPIDSANMDLSKANSSGVYIMPPFTTSNGKNIAGASIVEDKNITAGYFLAAKLEYYKVLIYKAFSMAWGWENDDFTKNLMTAIAEMRMHQFVKGIHEDEGVFIYDTFANVQAEITAA